MSNILLKAILIANMLFAVIIVFGERKRPLAALVWLLLLLFLPVVGFLVYMFFGQKLLTKRKFRLKREDDVRRGKIIANQHRQLVSLQDSSEDESANYLGLTRMNLLQASAPITLDNEVLFLVQGRDKFAQLLEDIRCATRFIHVEYFIWRDDELGQQLMAALTEKAQEGVEVRVIIDDWGCKLTPESLFQPLRAAGGKVYRFLPITLNFVFNANYRNHRKIVVIDGCIGYIGGMNVGVEYLGHRQHQSPWRDTHLRIVGPAVASLEARFLMDYIYVSREEVELGERYLLSDAPRLGHSPIQIVSSGPDSTEQHVKQGYLKMISSAYESINIQTPYLVPDDSVLEGLKIAAFSGVDVKIMLPGKPDKKLVYTVTMSYAGELLEAGARIFLYDGFLHSKAIIVDDHYLSIGTANMDMRSFMLNFEVNAFIYDREKASEYNAIFYKDIAHSRELSLAEYNSRSAWSRLAEGVCRLFAPIM
jgi:cardiolipin synthase